VPAPPQSSFEYAVIRVVPRVEREEFINAGVLVYCLSRGFLAARVQLDEGRLGALCPEADTAAVRTHLEAIPLICSGDPAAGGPIAALPLRERFQWLVAPRSTMIQVSAVHTGLCDSPETVLERLFEGLVKVG
jgi:hypothetical protein